jgi:hypothetical protein
MHHQDPHTIGCAGRQPHSRFIPNQDLCPSNPPPLRPWLAPGLHGLNGSMPCQNPEGSQHWAGSTPGWAPGPQTLPVLSSMWNNQSHTMPGSQPLGPCLIPARLRILPLRASHQLCMTQLHPPSYWIPDLRWSQTPALQAFQITTPLGSHSDHHYRAPNLPKRHIHTGLDAKGITSEQQRLQLYCSRTGDFLFFFSLL